MVLKMGEIVFFRRCKRSSKRKAAEMELQGHGFGVFLGHVPPFVKDPEDWELLRMMGQAGFISFDDVRAFLGEETLKDLLTKFTKTYYGRNQEELMEEAKSRIQAVKQLKEQKASGLVDASGKPVNTEFKPTENYKAVFGGLHEDVKGENE